jgi:hypothetical protein
MWKPYCSQRANYSHEVECLDAIACPYCGLANPAHVITIPDSPPARQSTSHHISPRFEILNPASSNFARQNAIKKHQQEDRPNAGSLIHSSRPKTTLIPKSKLAAIQRKFPVYFHLYLGYLDDPDLKVYSDWQLIRMSFT